MVDRYWAPMEQVPANVVLDVAAPERLNTTHDHCWMYILVPPERRRWLRILNLALHRPDECLTGHRSPRHQPHHARKSEEFRKIDYIELFGTHVELPEEVLGEATPSRDAFHFSDAPLARKNELRR